ncbi:hypothetical protein I6A60_00435 [Frankia sp. AgB1.9]|uniref:hypothetical protein n=1 Tax=unclassified Frankia TaxID=2632575 RepID=UPI001933A5A3|nr:MULTISPECIES: hypothetical protein [unclassified Frankia]MBL7487347.1 hypothetical protein [Frankia sp. AgW1.1]MBL7546355.1 hypothetical protein [Frankia sp. AgB1.9]MBL7618599.1 hypothetical protein [Frankia sp. AgB1.8]
MTDDRTAATEPARRGLMAKFERQVDPEGKLSPQERARRAESALKAHMARMSAAAAKARALRRSGLPDRSQVAEGQPLAGHRVLVIGGSEADVQTVRRQVRQAGGVPTRQLTVAVTDVVCLSGGDRDRRAGRIHLLDLPVLTAQQFAALVAGERPDQNGSPT